MFDTSPQALTERIMELRARITELERDRDGCMYSAQRYQGERDTAIERVRVLERELQALAASLAGDADYVDSTDRARDMLAEAARARTLLADATPAAPESK